MNIIRGSVIGLAGAVGAGVLAWPVATAFADDDRDRDELYIKRDEQTAEIASVDDEDDDDSNDDTGTNSKFTGFSKATNDNTRSNFTKVSRDRDKSRSDKTKDRTRDGGDGTRDVSANHTNDKSRNDTRSRR